MSGLTMLRRIARMGPRELLFRGRERAYCELERAGLYPARIAAPRDFREYLAAACAERFYPGHRPGSFAAVVKEFPDWISRARDGGIRLSNLEVELQGRGAIKLESPIDWHRDPFTGRTWDVHFWRDYDLENDPQQRDPKIIHEINRHQHLPRLAKAFAWTGEERFAAEAVAQWESWIVQNPPGMGINWESSLEIAIRTISWLWTLALLLPSRSLSAGAAQRIGDSLFTQLEHVHRYPSVYSSANTHLLGEGTALFIAGLVFRDHPRGRAWLAHGTSLLKQQAGPQILEDGVYGELSSYYHCYALDFYLLASILGEHNGHSLGPQVRGKIQGMLEFLQFLTRPDGTIPMLGDDDGGRALALVRTTYRSSLDLLCLGALVLGRTDFKHQAGELSEEAFWLLGANAVTGYQKLGSQPPAATTRRFPAAGYCIHRSGWSPGDSHLVFDCGDLGMLNGGHAHADALSVALFGHGRELLADPGTYVYNGAPEWRNYFRSTRAHNTATVAGYCQAEPGSTFRWKTGFDVRSRRIETGCVEYIEAEHTGYRRISSGPIHRRRLLYIPGEYWLLADDLQTPSAGSGLPQGLDLHFHLGRDVEISSLLQTPASIVLRAGACEFLLAIFGSHEIEWRQSRGETDPISGWHSDVQGHKQPAWELCAAIRGSAPPAAITVLDPAGGATHVERLAVESGNALGCVVARGAFRDIFILPAVNQDVVAEGFQVRGDLLWIRTRGGEICDTFALGSHAFVHPGRVTKEDTCAVLAGY